MLVLFEMEAKKAPGLDVFRNGIEFVDALSVEPAADPEEALLTVPHRSDHSECLTGAGFPRSITREPRQHREQRMQVNIVLGGFVPDLRAARLEPTGVTTDTTSIVEVPLN